MFFNHMIGHQFNMSSHYQNRMHVSHMPLWTTPKPHIPGHSLNPPNIQQTLDEHRHQHEIMFYHRIQRMIPNRELLRAAGFPIWNEQFKRYEIQSCNYPFTDENFDNISHDKISCSRCFTGGNLRQQWLTNECVFHAGRKDQTTNNYVCCGSNLKFPGCTRKPYHVWSGLQTGINQLTYDFVQTSTAPQWRQTSGNYGVFAIDCEMCYTAMGLELTKVSVVDCIGQLIYNTLVRTTSPIIDYNTTFSGINDFMMARGPTKSLGEVQHDLLNIFNENSILIGHAIHNDLRALKMVHYAVVDTSLVFPHPRKFPFRLSLKSIMQQYLKKNIQTIGPHCSEEDSRSSLEVIWWLIDSDTQFKTGSALNSVLA